MYSHVLDVERLLNLETIEDFIKCPDFDLVKPVLIIVVDGGPDENPRYQKTIVAAVHYFTSYNLDAICILCNAPGRSAFNRVKRRMHPLSTELAGLILPHEHYGSHLDDSGKTIDSELELRNFTVAGNTLAEVWNDLIIDDYPVCAEWIEPNQSEVNPAEMNTVNQKFLANHFIFGHYCVQGVKCDDRNCCLPFRSPYKTVMPSRFLPFPLPIMQTPQGLKAPEIGTDHNDSQFLGLFQRLVVNEHDVLPDSAAQFAQIPFDIYCPH